MKKLLFVTLLPFALLLPNLLAAQESSCIYRLELTDTQGDGWDGAQLQVTINGNLNVYTLLDGDSTSIYLRLAEGDQLDVNYLPGDFDGQTAFALYTELEEPIFEETGLNPFGGQAFSVSINCPNCPLPPLSSIRVDHILDKTATINWLAPNENDTYVIEFGPRGIVPGEGDSLFYAAGTTGPLTLGEKTAYTFYLSTLCANGDTSQVAGPFHFETCYTNDVGAYDILAPFTDCDLSAADTVVTVLKNYGAAPQSLVRFKYSVNGEEVEITTPQDGVYTGVLGKDSTRVTQFDATYNFSNPGAYFIEVWTEYDEDSDLTNDTTSTIIYSIPTINNLPYVENFESDFSGWTVGDDSENPSWAVGFPTGAVINRAAKGLKAWATNLNGMSNANEQSYLVSPCMDFSAIADDPIIAFQSWLSTEVDRDQLWLESSIDGGQNWSRVETLNYNGPFVSYTGDNPLTDWERQYGLLQGLGGEADVKLRFVYFTDFATQLEGVAIDDIQIFAQGQTDLMLNAAYVINDPICTQGNDASVDLMVTNIGLQTIDTFSFSYQVNGEPVVTQILTNTNLNPGAEDIVNFSIPVSLTGSSRVYAWISTPGDANLANDTLIFQINSSLEAPFSEDFESGTLASNWTTNTNTAIVTNGHGNSSYVLSQNLRLQSPQLVATTPYLGPIEVTDTFSFDYRFVDFVTNQDISFNAPGIMLVQVGTTCNDNFTTVLTIDQTEPTTSTDLATVSIPLADFAGSVIQVRVISIWAGGNYWFDLDNFQIPRCTADLNLDVTFDEQVDGSVITSIRPLDGKGPYEYTWSTGETTSSITIPATTYDVTVTDQFGCQGFYSGLPVSVEEVQAIRAINLYPNPTTANSQLQIQFEIPTTAQVDLLNAYGQIISRKELNQVWQTAYDINLSDQSGGLYFVRVTANGQSLTRKLLLLK